MNKKLIIGIIMMIGILSLGVNAANTGIVTFDAPANSSTILGTISLNGTASNGDGSNVSKYYFDYKCTANSTNTIIGNNATTLGNNVTDLKFNWTTSTIEDCTLTSLRILAEFDFGNNTKYNATSNLATLVVNNTAVSTTLISPTNGLRNASQNHILQATTSEEVSSLQFKVGNTKYAGTGSANGKSWTASVTNLAPSSYDWNVETADQAGSGVIKAQNAFSFIVESKGVKITQQAVNELNKKTQDSIPTNKKLLILGIVIVIAYMATKKKR